METSESSVMSQDPEKLGAYESLSSGLHESSWVSGLVGGVSLAHASCVVHRRAYCFGVHLHHRNSSNRSTVGDRDLGARDSAEADQRIGRKGFRT